MKIHLDNMVFYGFHGVYPEERKLGQRFNVNLCVYTDNKLDRQITELKDTVDYTQLYDVVKEVMEGKQFEILENGANDMIETIFADFPLVCRVKVSIEKPGVPINGTLSHVAIEMDRNRGKV